MNSRKAVSLRSVGIHQPVDAAFADAHQIGYGNCCVIEDQCKRRAMKVSAAQHVSGVGKNQRVVGCGAALNLDNFASVTKTSRGRLRAPAACSANCRRLEREDRSQDGSRGYRCAQAAAGDERRRRAVPHEAVRHEFARQKRWACREALRASWLRRDRQAQLIFGRETARARLQRPWPECRLTEPNLLSRPEKPDSIPATPQSFRTRNRSPRNQASPSPIIERARWARARDRRWPRRNPFPGITGWIRVRAFRAGFDQLNPASTTSQCQDVSAQQHDASHFGLRKRMTYSACMAANQI